MRTLERGTGVSADEARRRATYGPLAPVEAGDEDALGGDDARGHAVGVHGAEGGGHLHDDGPEAALRQRGPTAAQVLVRQRLRAGAVVVHEEEGCSRSGGREHEGGSGGQAATRGDAPPWCTKEARRGTMLGCGARCHISKACDTMSSVVRALSMRRSA